MTVTRIRERHPFAFRRLTVTGIRSLTPELVRITLTGDMSGFASTGPADHVKAYFPGADGVLYAPRIEGDRTVRDEGVDYIARDYTPFSWTEATLDLDFVLHGDDGPAAKWAANAAHGDELVIGGPRGSRQLPEGADWWVLCADATALPALYRWLAEAPAGQRIEAYVFGETESLAEYPLPEGADVTWVLGNIDPESVLRDLGLQDREGTGYFWAAGDSNSLIGARRYLRRELGLPRDQVDIDGYWRSGVANADHHDPIDPTDPED